MNCKKCGAYLVSGQVICSNCDTDNSNYLSEQPNYGQTQDTNVTQNNAEQYNSQDHQTLDDFNNQNQYLNQTQSVSYGSYSQLNTNSFGMQNEVKQYTSNKKGRVFIIILVLVTAIIGIKVFISRKDKGLEPDKGNVSSFINSYQMLQRQVKLKMLDNDVVSCDEDCKAVYDIDDEKYTFKVTDLDNYYKLEFELKSNYKDTQFTSKDCANLENTVCSKNIIIGRVYKP